MRNQAADASPQTRGGIGLISTRQTLQAVRGGEGRLAEGAVGKTA